MRTAYTWDLKLPIKENDGECPDKLLKLNRKKINIALISKEYLQFDDITSRADIPGVIASYIVNKLIKLFACYN